MYRCNKAKIYKTMERKEMKLKDSVVLITGGAGNIGSYIVDEILKQEPKLCIIVDNFFNVNNTRTGKNIKVYPFDIANVEELSYVFEKYSPEYVFHCASMLIQDSELLPRKSINTNIASCAIILITS